MATATAYHLPRPDNRSSTLEVASNYPRGLGISDFDFGESRYPTLNTSSAANRRASTTPTGPSDWEGASDGARRINSDPLGMNSSFDAGVRESKVGMRGEAPFRSGNNGYLAEAHQQFQPSRLEAVVQYALPADTARRVVERYSLDENRDGVLSPASDRPLLPDSPQEESITASQHRQDPGRPTSRERPISALPAAPRHPSIIPGAGIGAGPSNRDSTFSPIVPSSAAPSHNPAATLGIPVSPKPRAYVQQPTYVTPSLAPNPMNPVYLPNPPIPQEEVCVECAMRDQDMADVDVTGPGVWERESDVLYEELVRREQEEDASEIVSNESHRSNRPRAKGGKLTEPNLRVWLTMNPKEPQARQQTLQLYLKTQRALLEAETLAHARAMQESRQLDSRMRDAYSQLRRSAYDMGSNITPSDDIGGVRIMSPRSPSGTTGAGPHGHSHSREVTLLENGMIVEHVDVRKEEREERERRRREEKQERSRARKSSRGSVYSVRSLATPVTDSGLGLRPNTRYSASNAGRPTSVITTSERPPSFPRAYSQASFSDVHSLGSGSPRQRFFGFRTLSSGWRSRDSLAPSGMSGSTVDMHVALQREGYEQRMQSPIDLGSKAPSLRHSQAWPRTDNTPQIRLQEVPKKKKGFAKIWGMVTGSKDKGRSQVGSYNDQTQSFDRTEDDLPLAPPPPLSYLVERGPGEHNAGARQSTISLPSTSSPKNGLSSPAVSPGTASSSLLPSPSSSRPSNVDAEMAGESKKPIWNPEDRDPLAEAGSMLAVPRALHPVTSEPDIRRAQQEQMRSPSVLTPTLSPPAMRPQSMIMRDKSLPPLPDEINLHPPADHADPRPRTMYSYDHRQIPAGASPPVQDLAAPRAPFRTEETRRQSFSGMTARPNIMSQTLPTKGAHAEFKPPAGRYDEFGTSRRSLGYMEHIQEKRPLQPLNTPTKRKSKFGLASLLGRKSQLYGKDFSNGVIAHDFMDSRRSASDFRDDAVSSGGYPHSASRHSVGPRMSVMSRKAIEDLVEQDPNFVAYRYPSNDQRVDLLP